jgi:hypothetical protein
LVYNAEDCKQKSLLERKQKELKRREEKCNSNFGDTYSFLFSFLFEPNSENLISSKLEMELGRRRGELKRISL